MAKLVNAFSDDALGTLDAVGVAAAIASGKISATEAVEAAIQRAEKVNGELNAIVYKTYDMARDKAKSKLTGALAGVPTFIKDNEPVKGIPTQLGTGAFKSKPAKKNGKYVDQLLSTGLNMIGKTTLPEFGFICSTENPKWGITRSPWDTDYTTGGSSSGSAAMVTSGVVPIAVANDGAGSTRIPASCCGLVGLKPTRGRLRSPEGTDILPINIVYEGVLTRSVRDTAAFYAAAEKHYRNAALPEMGNITHAGQKRLKVVFFENLAEGKPGHQDEATHTTLVDTAKLLSSLGHEVEQLPFPPFDIGELSADFLNYYGMLAFALSSLGGLLLDSKPDRSQLEPFTIGLSDQFKRNFWGMRRSLKRLQAAGRMMEGFFDKYDIILTPVVAHTVPRIGHFSADLSYPEISKKAIDFAPFTGMQNISGSPAISIPSGTSADGLPIGMHFIAPFGHERRLLELAYELELAKPWRFIYNS